MVRGWPPTRLAAHGPLTDRSRGARRRRRLDVELARPECDGDSVRALLRGARPAPLPPHVRGRIWKVRAPAGGPCASQHRTLIRGGAVSGQMLLRVEHKPHGPLHATSEPLDADQLSQLHADCTRVAGDDAAASATMERLISLCSRARSVPYASERGWARLLWPLLDLGLPEGDVYNAFTAILDAYIPRNCVERGLPLQVLRLLLLYHDPELGIKLDSCTAAVDPVLLAWIRCLFSGTLAKPTLLAVWDAYFVAADPFMVFFLSIVLLLNCRDAIMTASSCPALAELISKAAGGVQAADVSDFIEVAQHYASRTPYSFFKVRTRGRAGRCGPPLRAG